MEGPQLLIQWIDQDLALPVSKARLQILDDPGSVGPLELDSVLDDLQSRILLAVDTGIT